MFRLLVVLIAWLAIACSASAQTGSLSTDGQCTIPTGGSVCSVNFQWNTTDASYICLWDATHVQVFTCQGYASYSGTFPNIGEGQTTLELRAHYDWPDGTYASYANSINLSTAIVQGIPSQPPMSGTLTSDNQCTISETGTYCSVNFQWNTVNVSYICLWDATHIQVSNCQGYPSYSGTFNYVAEGQTTLELRAHSNWPDGTYSSYASAVGLSSKTVTGIKQQPQAIACLRPTSISATPDTLVRGASSYVTLTATCANTGSWTANSAGAPPVPAIQPATQQTVQVGPFLQVGTFQYMFGIGIVTITVVDPPATQPTLEEATTFTASCPDKFCIRATGFNFAANSYLEFRTETQFLGTIVPTIRGRNGEADYVEAPLTDINMRNAISIEVPKVYISILNPGSPPGVAGPIQVLRSGTSSVAGRIDSYSTLTATPTSGVTINGWACVVSSQTTEPVTVEIRQDTKYGALVSASLANQVGPVSVGQSCGGNENRFFSYRWPDKYRDGQPRRFFASAYIGKYMHAIPDLNLLNNSPMTITLQRISKRAEYIGYSLSGSYVYPEIANVVAGSTHKAYFKYKNIGDASWTRASSFALRTIAPNNNTVWAVSRVELPTESVLPGQETEFIVNYTAPANAGNYKMQWSLIQEPDDWFGDPTAELNIVVVPRSNGASINPIQPDSPLTNSPLPYGYNPPATPVLVSPPINQ